jgi:hypothetical protein
VVGQFAPTIWALGSAASTRNVAVIFVLPEKLGAGPVT